MSNIVAVMGSPNSEGNTASAVDAVLNGAMGLSTNIIKYYNLSKLKFIHGCRHCHHCVYTGKCDLEDDISPVLEDLRKADTILFATPIYFGMPTAQFVVVLDRMYSFLSIDRKTSSLSGKNAIILVSCNEINDNNLRMLETLVNAIEDFGMTVTDRLIYSDNNGSEMFNSNSKGITKAYEVGKKLSKKGDIAICKDVVCLNDD